MNESISMLKLTLVAALGVIAAYFDSGLWSVERVRNAVVKNWITAEEFKMITGEEYEV